MLTYPMAAYVNVGGQKIAHRLAVFTVQSYPMIKELESYATKQTKRKTAMLNLCITMENIEGLGVRDTLA